MHARLGGEGLKGVYAPRSEDFLSLFVFMSEEALSGLIDPRRARKLVWCFRVVSCSKAPTAKEGWYRRIGSFGKGREA